MAYIFDFSESKTAINTGNFLLDNPTVPMIGADDFKLSYIKKKGVVAGFDPRFEGTWTFKGPAVGSKTKTVETLKDKPLSEVQFQMPTGDGLLKLTINGIDTLKNGSHPDLTLDVFLTNTFDDLTKLENRYIGTDFADFFYGDTGKDVMFGGDGDDSLNGFTGDDVMFGGKGADRMSGNGVLRLYGGDGDDDLASGASGSKLYGGAGNDVMSAQVAYNDDQMFGGKGDDTIDGDYGNDRVFGGGGADELDGAEGDDLIKGQGGADDLNGDDGDDRMYGGNGDDRLDGGAGHNAFYGGAGRDIFTVDEGVNTLFGGKGDDFFIFDGGINTIDGGAGAELYVFRSSGFADAQSAVITDFEDGVDLLRFSLNFPDNIRSPDDFKTVKDTSKGLKLVVEDGWEIYLEGMKAKDFSAADISESIG